MTPDPYSLDQLRDIIEPAPVAWWPPAMGGQLLLTLLLIWLIAFALLAWLRYRRNAYRRAALAQLATIEKALDDPITRVTAVRELSALLKRVALIAFSRDEVAALSGESWLAFLDRSGGGRVFSQGAAAIIGSAAYDSTAAADLDQTARQDLIGAARHWIRHHRQAA